MFKPSGDGIYVPLGQVTWDVSAERGQSHTFKLFDSELALPRFGEQG
jgi:hypothetical protein